MPAWEDFQMATYDWTPPAFLSATDTLASTVADASANNPAQPERLAPDAVSLLIGFTSGAVSDIQDDPDSPDANWMIGNATGEVLMSFPTPTNTLKAGFTQEFRIRVRPGTG